MRIAFIGNFATKKGSNEFTELVLKLKNKHKWYIFGYIGDTKNFEKIKKYIKKSRSYSNNELPILIKKNKIDAALILSIWSETYSKTFFETLKTEVPVFAFKTIGYPEYILGKNYPYFVNNIDSLINKINSLNIKSEEHKIFKEISTKINQRNLNNISTKYKIIDRLLA